MTYSTGHTIYSTTYYFHNLTLLEFKRGLMPQHALGFWAPLFSGFLTNLPTLSGTALAGQTGKEKFGVFPSRLQ